MFDQWIFNEWLEHYPMTCQMVNGSKPTKKKTHNSRVENKYWSDYRYLDVAGTENKWNFRWSTTSSIIQCNIYKLLNIEHWTFIIIIIYRIISDIKQINHSSKYYLFRDMSNVHCPLFSIQKKENSMNLIIVIKY